MSEQTTSDDPRRRRLEEVIGAFLVAVDAGQNPDTNEWLTRHRDLCPELAEFFADLGRMDKLVEPLKHAPSQSLAQPTMSVDSTDEGTPRAAAELELVATQADIASADAGNGESGSATLAKGTRVRYFGDYELEKVLGEGGMGIVYKALQRSLNRLVALKMIKATRFPSADEVRRFQNEAEAVARLDHPNIVPIYEVNQFEDQHYFAMKLIAGESLDKRLKDYITDPKRAARLVTTTAAAIHHAHQRGILHRDLKPANILVDPQGQPHVTDFGLAKRVEGDSELTRSGAIVGTPAYMAPEQATAKRGAVTTATDVYGLGAVLYALLAGRAPFTGATVLDTLEQVRERPPESPRKLNPRAPRDLEVICLKCLEKEPQRRYGSADALAEDLIRWQAGEPIAARPAGNATRAWMWCRRNPVVAGAAGSVAAALMAVVLLSLLYARQQTHLALAQKLYGDEQSRRANEQALATAKIAAQSKELDKQSQNLKASLADTNRRLAMFFFERAQRAFDGGLVNQGLLWLVETWRYAAKADDKDWQHLARANLGMWRYRCPEVKGVVSYGDGVHVVAFSRDGRLILTVEQRHSVRLWDASSGLPTGQPITHPEIVDAALSPNCRIVMTAGADRTVRLWDASTGRAIGRPLQHDYFVLAMAFSPDSKTVLIGESDGTVDLWEAATCNLIAKVTAHQLGLSTQVTFSPNGKTFLTLGTDYLSWSARLWHSATLRPIGSPMNLGSAPAASAFSPDGRTIITGDKDGRMQFWDAATTHSLRRPLQDEGPVVSIIYAPDGKTILTRYAQSTAARLWDAASCLPIGKVLGHQNQINSAAFSPDGKVVITGSSDGTARLWDSATGLPLGQPMVHQSPVISVAYSPNGTTVLTASKNVFLWEPAAGQPLGRPLEHHGPIHPLAYDPSGKKILTGGPEKAVRLWSAVTAEPIGEPMVQSDFISAATITPDGRTVLTVRTDNLARLWDAASGRLIGRAMDQGNPPRSQGMMSQERVLSVAYSPDGRTIVAESGAGRKVTLWDASSGRRVLGRVDANQVAFSPDSRTILTANEQGTARKWDAATERPIGQPLVHQKSVSFVGFSPDGKTILTVSGGIASVWDAASSQLIGRPIAARQAIRPIAFSPDSRRILARTGADALGVWDIASGRPVGQPITHQHSVTTVALSPDFRILLTGSVDGKVRMWDTGTGQTVGPALFDFGRVVSIVYSPDGKTFTTANDGPPPRSQSQARLWHAADLVDDDLSRVQTWVETITALEVNKNGNIAMLESSEWRARRERLQKLGGAPESNSGWLLDSIIYGPDPTARARAWAERRSWAEAEAAFTEVIHARPLLRSAWVERGRFYVARSEPAKAAADFERAMSLGERRRELLVDIVADDRVLGNLLARSLADAKSLTVELLINRVQDLAREGRLEQARAVLERIGALPWEQAGSIISARQLDGRFAALGCPGLVDAQFRKYWQTTDPLQANMVAWNCALAPGAFSDLGAPVRLAEFAARGFPAHEKHIALNTLGAALYRAGRFEEAIGRLEEAIKARNGAGEPLDWPWLAMAHFRLGHRDEAHRWLDRLRNRAPSNDPDEFWDELEIGLLRSEAEAAILYDPAFPADPFAH
jgi:eukaryotic-like serine/threonine-protein kinase